jgi:hypothetical protein
MPSTPICPTLTRIASVRFSEDEYARLQLAAEDRSLSVSDLIRRAALKRELPAPHPPTIDLAAVMQLRRIGTNLNQSVRIIAAWKRSAKEDRKEHWERWRLTAAELRTLCDALVRRLAER